MPSVISFVFLGMAFVELPGAMGLQFSMLSIIISSHNFLPSSSPLETPFTRVFGCVKCSHSSGMHCGFGFFSLCVSFHMHSSSGFYKPETYQLCIHSFGATYLIRIITPLSTCCYCREGSLMPRTVRTLAAFS